MRAIVALLSRTWRNHRPLRLASVIAAIMLYSCTSTQAAMPPVHAPAPVASDSVSTHEEPPPAPIVAPPPAYGNKVVMHAASAPHSRAIPHSLQ